ncbi:SIS binding protein [Perkinsus olseni]|uniref:SIS binding protein n=1 Tax=Perkinsus olseni TaxID=32597 RepID=A0A7J6PSW8_PEROL|nr:SIS binding protein [Perkinsus olseni]KAF4735156.1 SIS binding protein [Perkinsus olseni]
MAKAAQKQRRDGIPETITTEGQEGSKVERGRYEQRQARAPRTDANRTRKGKNPPKGESKGRKAPSLNSELVEDMTALRMGKARLVSKNKNKPSKLKEVILHDKVNDDGDDDTKSSDGRNVPEITVRHYVHQTGGGISYCIYHSDLRSMFKTYLSPELDALVQDMLEDLHRYQERAKENPAKFKKRKRFVTGLREVSRALRLGKLKGVIVAPNMHSSESSGGLDERVVEIVDEASMGGGSSAPAKSKLDTDRQAVPVVFALSKNRLGKACGKPVRQCAVGLLSVEGAERKWKQITEMTEELRRKWLEERLLRPPTSITEVT